MANKTIRGFVPKHSGITVYALVIPKNQAKANAINGSGDACTFNNGSFTFTLTEAASGWYDVQLFKSSDDSEYTAREEVWIPGDIAGTYDIGSKEEEYVAGFINQVFPPIRRVVGDTNAIRFLMPAQTTITGTKSINNGSYSAVSGAITYIGTNGSHYEYNLAYNANDRSDSSVTVRYLFTDGTNTRAVVLELYNALTDAQAARLELIGTAQATFSAPVSSKGVIDEIIRGDDYLAANGRAFEWTWTPTTGYVLATSDCFFGGISACDGVTVGWSIEGIITEVDGVWTLSFDMGKATTAALSDSQYDWSVQVTNAAGYETTPWKSKVNQPVIVVNKQT